MKRSVVTMPSAIVLAFVFASVPAVAQTPAAAKKAPAKAYTPAKTPWGDPDLSGVYTNKDENGIPVERPSQFEGKKLDDVDDSEFAEIVRERNEASVDARARHRRRRDRRRSDPLVRALRREEQPAVAGHRSRGRQDSTDDARGAEAGRRPCRGSESAAVRPIRTRIAASTTSASRAGFPAR